MLRFGGELLTNLLYFALHLSSSSSFPPPLSAAKEREYLERMKRGEEDAADVLIEHNLRLVAHIIKKYYASFSEQEDLISIGTIGLIKASGRLMQIRAQGWQLMRQGALKMKF